MPAPVRINLVLQRGQDNTFTYPWSVSNGFTWWTPSAVHAVGDVVKVFPDAIQISPGITSPDGRTLLQAATVVSGLYLRCTTAGTSSATSPAVPFTPGAVVVDGGVTWVVQTDTFVAVNDTNYTADLHMRPAPDDVASSPTLSLSSTSGAIVLGGANGLITTTIAKAQVETLLQSWTRGYYDLRMTPPSGGTPAYVLFGVVNVVPSSTR